MRNIPLVALRGCPGHAEGDEFMANHVEAKCLVALGRAQHAQTYMTRDMNANQRAEVNASPAARKLAAERGIDLYQIKGTGRNGNVTLKDVQDA